MIPKKAIRRPMTLSAFLRCIAYRLTSDPFKEPHPSRGVSDASRDIFYSEEDDQTSFQPEPEAARYGVERRNSLEHGDHSREDNQEGCEYMDEECRLGGRGLFYEHIQVLLPWTGDVPGLVRLFICETILELGLPRTVRSWDVRTCAAWGGDSGERNCLRHLVQRKERSSGSDPRRRRRSQSWLWSWSEAAQLSTPRVTAGCCDSAPRATPSEHIGRLYAHTPCFLCCCVAAAITMNRLCCSRIRYALAHTSAR